MLTTIILTLLVFMSVHSIVTILICLHLKIQLKQGDLNTFKRILGIRYHRMRQNSGYTKYKWQVAFITVRAGFDENDRLLEFEIKPYSFFPLTYKTSYL